MKTIPRKRGRPKIHENPVWFGMKISLEQREKIKKVAKERGMSASHALMEAFEKSIDDKPLLPKRMTAKELRKLSKEERGERLRIQTEHAAHLYKPGGELDFSDDQDYIEYS